MDALPTLKEKSRSAPLDAIEHLMPARDLPYRLAHRVAGLGSLGHARYVAIADWNGGRIAREAKALVSSACYWAKEDQWAVRDSLSDHHQPRRALSRSFCPVTRPLDRSPPQPALLAHRIGHAAAPGQELRLLRAMGWETANIHLGTKTARKPILRHMQKQKGKWLHRATEEMLNAVRDDWKTWEKDGYA